MNRLQRFITEIHRRSLWQVLLIYIGGAWVCYEIIDTITDRLALPPWLPVLAIVLFFVGLPFVLATAFVGEVARPAAARPDAEPHIAEAEAAAAGLEARRRHRLLTWRNAGLSFLAALALWGVVATGWMLFGRGAGESATPDDRPSVAVLPLENRSGLEEDQYFTDGIHDELLTQLYKIGGLSVRGRTSVMEYRDRTKNLRQIGEELNARYLMEGGVQRAGETVRINVQLIDSETDEHVFAETYDRELSLENLLAVQREVALSIADSLEARLTPQEREQIERVPTDNFDAYDYYLRGREFMAWSSAERDARIAVEMFEVATRLDPSFALAYAKLSLAHSSIYWFDYDRSQERLRQMKRAADRALELDPDLPEAHEALGYYYYWGHLDYERALQEFVTALSQQPGNADLLEGVGNVERRRGNFDAGLAHFKKAAELEPREALKQFHLAVTYILLRDYPEAERYCDRALALAPDWIELYAAKGWLYVRWQGSTPRARAVLGEVADRGLDILVDPYAGHLSVTLDIWDGQYEAALTRLSSVSSTAFNTQFFFIPKPLLAAQIYDLMNETELARQHYDSAAAVLEAKLEETVEDSRLHSALGTAYAGLGRVEDAVRAGVRGVDLLPVSKDAMGGLYRVEDLAGILTMTGQHNAAIDQIDFLLSVPGFMSVALLRLDPRWGPLRSHPRFQTLLEEYEQRD
ncbi:MAG: tetratricopeptide repeat protein [Gemmatimonadota bacterium]|nr:MAG: tetratricopeptide repeat protein [Gemmatimonadota bacterium]